MDQGVTPTFVKHHPVQGVGMQQDNITQTPCIIHFTYLGAVPCLFHIALKTYRHQASTHFTCQRGLFKKKLNNKKHTYTKPNIKCMSSFRQIPKDTSSINVSHPSSLNLNHNFAINDLCCL